MIDSKKAWHWIRWFLKQQPVREEQSGKRSLAMSAWLRANCRPSKKGCNMGGLELGCFVAFDLDFVLWDYLRRMMQLLEVKTHNGGAAYPQRETFKVVNDIMTLGAPLARVRYLGLHYLVLSGETPDDSETIRWDNKVIYLEECWRKINMLDAL